VCVTLLGNPAATYLIEFAIRTLYDYRQFFLWRLPHVSDGHASITVVSGQDILGSTRRRLLEFECISCVEQVCGAQLPRNMLLVLFISISSCVERRTLIPKVKEIEHSDICNIRVPRNYTA